MNIPVGSRPCFVGISPTGAKTRTIVLNSTSELGQDKTSSPTPPCITATNAYIHALDMQAVFQAALSSIASKGPLEYVIQTGFNTDLLQHRGFLIQEIYVFLDGDVPILNEEIVSSAFRKFFSPFPGVVYTREHSYRVIVDLPADPTFCKISSLGGFDVIVASLVGGEGTHGRHESKDPNIPPGGGDGDADNDRSENSEDHYGGRNDPNENCDEHGGGNKIKKTVASGDKLNSSYISDIEFMSTLKIKVGGVVSHTLVSKTSGVIKVGECVEHDWPATKLGVETTAVAVACQGEDDPGYSLSFATVHVTACSRYPPKLVFPTPRNVFMDGDTKKKAVNKTTTGNFGVNVGHVPTLSASVAMGKGANIEKVSARWDIQFHDLTTAPTYLLDDQHPLADGGFWVYQPNNEDFTKVNNMAFERSMSPSGIFLMTKSAPIKLEIKLISFWQSSANSKANLWDSIFGARRRQTEQTPGVFSNFLYGTSTVIYLDPDKVPSERIPFFVKDEFEVTLSKEPQGLRTLEREKDMEVSMATAIMGRAGRASLSDEEFRGQRSGISIFGLIPP
ncbi:hypothetical protein BGW80DRAFT_1289856 [Lactifluus volemus]|nr:hypothetical protein BGW80DRAFT_1289856 [Lactifluus volemus]